MADFKVGDKVRILDVSKIRYGSECWDNGDIVEVIGYFAGNPRLLAKKNAKKISYDGGLVLWERELCAIEKISDTSTQTQRIESLESEVASLKAEVESLKKAQQSPTITQNITVKSDADIPKIAEQLIAMLHRGETVLPALTPNQKRKAIIAEAKAFVAKYTPIAKVDTTPITKQAGDIRIEFVVNAKKRTVVALPYLAHLGVITRPKGIAKCAPDDVFNADIGKAIALGRALGLDVSKFEQAVKPTEVVVGQVVSYGGYERLFNVTKNYVNVDTLSAVFCERHRENVNILDDTEAQYV